MMFRDTFAVYSENHMRYINIHLPLNPKSAVKFPNNDLCLLKNKSVRQSQTEVMNKMVQDSTVKTKLITPPPY